MPAEVFRFKQFSVKQDRCAMKITTDAVLLGAWANVEGASSILDIGTGTGVIALMMAQRSEAMIDAIEIDENACGQAAQNFKSSEWSDRLTLYHSPLQEFFPKKTYDVIVTNPPYFVDDHKSGKRERDVARHSITLTYEELLSGINRLLSADGKAFMVIPIFHSSLLESLGRENGLFVTTVVNVTAVQGKTPYLSLLQFARQEAGKVENTMTIQDENGSFASEYRNLTKDFYLKF